MWDMFSISKEVRGRMGSLKLMTLCAMDCVMYCYFMSQSQNGVNIAMAGEFHCSDSPPRGLLNDRLRP